MLSILIPVYQFRVLPLLTALLEQAKALEIPFEIRLYDDASVFDYKPEQQLAQQETSLVFNMLPDNLGRSKIRNKLAAEAIYPWLLFMDADSAVVSPDFLQNYWDLRDKQQITVGGTSYAPNPPTDQSQFFRWHYGIHREQRSAAQRADHAFEGFSTHHFFCHRAVFDQVSFPEFVVDYGHEDTLFGFALEKAGFSIKHIDNPMDHIGLESAAAFLEKTKIGLRNLWRLKQSHPWVSTKLSRTYEKLERFRLVWAAQLFYKLFHRLLERYFNTSRPQLLLFDLYKLGYYSSLRKSIKA